MDNLAWSVLTNILYLGWTWAQGKAFILKYYVLPDSDSQTAAAAAMEANKTGGANIVGAAGSAPGARTNSWYVQGSPYAANLPATAEGGNPDASAATVGDSPVLQSDGTILWATAGGGGGFTGIGAFDTTPNANGLSSSGADVALSAADGTHPGGVSAAAQTFGGVKTFSSVPVAAGLTAPAATALTFTSNVADGASAVCHILNTGALVSTSGSKWLSIRTNGSEQYFFGVVGGVNTFNMAGNLDNAGNFRLTGAGGLVIKTAADSPLYLYGNCVDGAAKENAIVDTQATLSTAGAGLLVGKNNGTKVFAVEKSSSASFGIYLKSPDGTAYLLTIANGGTVNIAAAP